MLGNRTITINRCVCSYTACSLWSLGLNYHVSIISCCTKWHTHTCAHTLPGAATQASLFTVDLQLCVSEETRGGGQECFLNTHSQWKQGLICSLCGPCSFHFFITDTFDPSLPTHHPPILVYFLPAPPLPPHHSFFFFGASYRPSRPARLCLLAG